MAANREPDRRRDARRVLRGDPDYPRSLHDLARPPECLHVLGELPPYRRSAAIVGSRAATPYGLDLARRLAADLARMDIAVVSGLARGIDTAAHEGALDAGGVTLAVLPFPIGEVPRGAAAALAQRVAARGALLSELEPGAVSHKSVFLERNRLIAALASAVVVVEAAPRSGALSTANAARALQRPLLAVPGDVDRETSRGTNALLRSGAGFCTEAADVLAAIEGPLAVPGDADAGPVTEPASLTARIRAALASGERSTDSLVQMVEAGPGDVLAALLTLQLAGAVEARPGQRWRRRA